jgi:2-dehydro-3-deoxyphosphogluconate aldolase/(4S)-4-hydroxy-2-oxoglutarate aldolase
MSQLTALDQLAAVGVIAVIRAPSTQAALRGAEALVAGGVTGLEVTYSTPDAPAVIAALDEEFGDGIYLGAGTVTAPAQAREAADAGARFLVSPGTLPDIVEAMLATGRVVLPGALTPSEVMQCVRLGAHVVKIFPASLGGPRLLKALKGPFPDTPMMPTGGVSADNLADWLTAGAVAVGAGSELVSTRELAEAHWDVVTRNARRFTAALAAARAGVPSPDPGLPREAG